jgi:hypothetical protein
MKDEDVDLIVCTVLAVLTLGALAAFCLEFL